MSDTPSSAVRPRPQTSAAPVVGATQGRNDGPKGMPPSDGSAPAPQSKKTDFVAAAKAAKKKYDDAYALGATFAPLGKRIAGYFSTEHKKANDAKPAGPKQFRVFSVPSPETRVNLGEWVKDPAKADLGAAFGYPGYSMFTAASAFSHVAGPTVFQGIGNVTHQTPALWTQLSLNWDASTGKQVRLTSGESFIVSAGTSSVPTKDGAKEMPVGLAGDTLEPPEFDPADLHDHLLDQHIDSFKFVLKSTVKVTKLRRELGVPGMPVPELSIWELFAMALHKAAKAIAKVRAKLKKVEAALKKGAEYAKKASAFLEKHKGEVVAAWDHLEKALGQGAKTLDAMLADAQSQHPLGAAFLAGGLGGVTPEHVDAGALFPKKEGLLPHELRALETGDFRGVEASHDPAVMGRALQSLGAAQGLDLSPEAAQNMLTHAAGGSLPQTPGGAVSALQTAAQGIGLNTAPAEALGALQQAGAVAQNPAGALAQSAPTAAGGGAMPGFVKDGLQAGAGLLAEKVTEKANARIDAFNKKGAGEGDDPKEFTVKKLDVAKDSKTFVEYSNDLLDAAEATVGEAKKQWAGQQASIETLKASWDTLKANPLNAKAFDANQDGKVSFGEFVDAVHAKVDAAAAGLDALASMVGALDKVLGKLEAELNRIAFEKLLKPADPKIILSAKDDIEFLASKRLHTSAVEGIHFDSESGAFNVHAEKGVALRTHGPGEVVADEHLWVHGLKSAELASKGPVAVGSRQSVVELLGTHLHLGALDPANSDRKGAQALHGGDFKEAKQAKTELVHALASQELVLQVGGEKEKGTEPKLTQTTPFYLKATEKGAVELHAKDEGNVRLQVGKFVVEIKKEHIRVGLAHAPTDSPEAAMLQIDDEGRIVLENGAARLGLDKKDAAFLLPGSSSKVELKKSGTKIDGTKINIG